MRDKHILRNSSAGLTFELGLDRTFVVVEIGINHDGNIAQAIWMINVAKDIGADAVKFQKRDVATAVGERGDDSCESIWGTTVFDKYNGRELGPLQCAHLARYAAEIGLFCFWSVWDVESVDALEAVGVLENSCAIKIPSAKATDWRLLRRAADVSEQYSIPVFLATGMCGKKEINGAIAQLAMAYSTIPFQCTSSYPCKPEDIHLNAMPRMIDRFFINMVGYSGHEEGFYPTLAAIGAGAVIVERHMTSDKTLPGSDHAMSLDYDEFKDMVKAIRVVDAAMGSVVKRILPCEQPAIERLKGVKRGEDYSHKRDTDCS